MKILARIENANRLIISLVMAFSLANVTTAWLAENSVDASIRASGKRLQALEAANLLAKGSDNLTNAARAFAATGDQQYLNAYRTELEVTRLTDRATERLLELGATSAEMELVAQAKRSAEKLAELESMAIQTAGAGESQKALNLVFGIEYRVAKENVMAPIGEAYAEIETRHTREVEELSAQAQLMSRLADGAMLLNILTVLTGLLYYFRKRVVAPVVQLAKQTQSLLAGGTEVRFKYLHEGSEIGDLARSLEAFRITSEQSESLRLTNSHIATITADIQRASDFKELAQIFFSRLAPLLDLGQASFYRTDDQQERLLLCGAYGRVGGADPDTEIPFGAGLLGQCAREQRSIVMNDPPQGYLQISSILGAAPPRMIALLPIKSATALLGVIELATFKALREEDRALLDRLLPVLAMCMEIIARNQHTEHLLKESLKQSVALENQQGEIRKLLEEQQTIFENTPHGIIYTADGIMVRANKRVAEQLGYGIDELVGNPAALIYSSPESHRELGAKIGPLLAAGQAAHTEWEFSRKDGSTFFAMLSGQAVKLFGHEQAAVWMFEDISARKRLEREMRESEERLRRILEDSPAGVSINTEGGQPIFANRRLSELLAVPAEELARRSTTEFWKHHADRDDFLARLRRDGHVNDYQAEFARSDGSTLTVLLSSMLANFGDDRQIVTWIYDITERKLAGEAAQKPGIEVEK